LGFRNGISNIGMVIEVIAKLI